MTIRRLVGIALMGFLILGLFGTCAMVFLGNARGHNQPSDDWWQGYMAGRLEEGEGGQAMPFAYPSYRSQKGHAPLLFGMGALCLLGLPLLLLGMGCMFFRHSRSWKGMYKDGPPFKRWHRSHRHMPPWWRESPEECDQSAEESADDETPR